MQEAFKRHLVTPYREADFWHEAVKRLAVVRQSVNQSIWLQLMSDRRLPENIRIPGEAWEALKQTPWIRTRANGRYVTCTMRWRRNSPIASSRCTIKTSNGAATCGSGPPQSTVR